MGGWGSGQRYSSRGTTDDHYHLDVRSLQRGGWLRAGVSSISRWTRRGVEFGSIGTRAETDQLILKYRNQHHGEPWESLEYPVRLERTRCHYGGERVWFLCPARGCGRRVAILYCHRYFVCRHCLGLVYESQRQSVSDRADARAWAIRERCGGWGCLFDPVLRPKGMHRRTFRRLERAYGIACHTSTI